MHLGKLLGRLLAPKNVVLPPVPDPPLMAYVIQSFIFTGFASFCGACVLICLAFLYIAPPPLWPTRRPQKKAFSAEASSLFELAQAHVLKVGSTLPMKQRLRLYSYFKQATCGDAAPAAPWGSGVVERTKHSSWAIRRGMAQQDARAGYVAAVDQVCPGWRGDGDDSVATSPAATTALAAAGKVDLRAASAAPATADEAALRLRISVLEAELARLTKKTMRGWLSKYSAQDASWIGPGNNRWARRYFVLADGGNSLAYYRSETDATPRRTIPLANCVVVDEGIKRTKLKGSHRIFSLWIVGTLDAERGPGSGALIRVSCASETETAEWFEALAAATGHAIQGVPTGASPPPPERRNTGPTAETREVASSASGPRQPLAVAIPSETERAAADQAAQATPSSRRKKLDPTRFPASRPMHRAAQPSLLSSSRAQEEGEPTNLSGFINLIFLAFVVTNARLMLENLRIYGIRVTLPDVDGVVPPNADVAVSWGWDWIRTVAVLVLPLLAAFAIERNAVRAPPNSLYRKHLVDNFNIANTLACLVAPCALVWSGGNAGGAAGGVLLLICSVTLFLKLVSWSHVHYDLRMADSESDEADDLDLAGRLAKFASGIRDTDGGVHVHYPRNVTLANLLYFTVAPTLCYQTTFPRSPSIRWGYLLSLSLRAVALGALLPAVCLQYIVPLLDHAAEAASARDLPSFVEHTLRLSLPLTYVWVTGFYAFFHVWLNLLAEILRFGDRVFYKAWWNATDFETYWRTWNIPVHHWIVRHAYFPILRHVTSSKSTTGFLCFFLSAVLHEVVVAFPLRSFYMPLAFFGMIAQVPLLPLSAWLMRRTRGTAFDQVGNYLFWSTFCFIGQPLCVVLYYEHASQSCVAGASPTDPGMRCGV